MLYDDRYQELLNEYDNSEAPPCRIYLAADDGGRRQAIYVLKDARLEIEEASEPPLSMTIPRSMVQFRITLHRDNMRGQIYLPGV